MKKYYCPYDGKELELRARPNRYPAFAGGVHTIGDTYDTRTGQRLYCIGGYCPAGDYRELIETDVPQDALKKYSPLEMDMKKHLPSSVSLKEIALGIFGICMYLLISYLI